MVADSGATKTDWRHIHSSQDIRSFQTNGYNPFFVDTTTIKSEVEKDLIPYMDSKAVKEVFFYGAGCSSVDRIVIIEDALIPLFPNARINVENDLLGAARSLFMHEKGIACILGTGSNSCLYDGKNIINNIPSLGFMLGDEGSASYIGKKILSEVLTEHAPKEICKVFNEKYGYGRAEILTHLYRKPFPNRFLASFSRFASENISNDFMRELVKNCFIDFFRTQLFRYEQCRELPVNFTGSVAHIFADILKEVADENNVSIGNIVQTPIDGLIAYHLEALNILMAAKFNSNDY